MRIQKINGKWTDYSRKLLRAYFNALEDGTYDLIPFQPVSGYRNTRYKYYYDCVIWNIIAQAGHKLKIKKGDEIRSVQTRDDAHLYMQLKYCYAEVVDEDTGIVRREPTSTTTLTDRQFYNEFLPQVVADFTSPPFYVEIPEREEWIKMRKDGTWELFKSDIVKAVKAAVNQST